MMIARNRRQAHLKTRGDHYHAVARTLEELHGEWPDVGYHVLETARSSCRRPGRGRARADPRRDG